MSSAALLVGNPGIDRILSIESNYLELLLSEEFDIAFGPDADLLSASIMRLARAQKKYGGITPLSDAAESWWRMGLDDATKRANRRTYGEWLYAICELPTPVARPQLQPTEEACNRVASFLRTRAPSARRWVCFNTGSSSRWQEKRWKARHYRNLGRLIADTDRETAIALVGGPDETELNCSLLASGAPFIDAGTNNSTGDFAALIAACEWILTPDSLGYHVACAVRTPAVCLVGPTSPWELDLYGVNHIYYADLECIACYLAKCPFSTTCMDRLTPELISSRITIDAQTWSPASGIFALSNRSQPAWLVQIRPATAAM
jgi:heptosyltransferase-1